MSSTTTDDIGGALPEPMVSAGGVDRHGVEPLLRVRDLAKEFPIRAGLFRRQVGAVHAVNGVSFDLYPNETLGVVGESGCGKSTMGRSLLRLIEPTRGQVWLGHVDVVAADKKELRGLRRDMQMVFQDPYASLSPRMAVREIISEPMRIQKVPKREAAERVDDLLRRVGLLPEHGNRFPHEFSGGQRQRIAIARALAVNPRLIICDEPTSALDVSIRAEVLELLQELQQAFGVSYLFITHDLSIVPGLAHRVGVMRAGVLVEQGSAEQILTRPQHPYTQALLSSVPKVDPA